MESKHPLKSNTYGGLATMLLLFFLPRMGISVTHQDATLFGHDIDMALMGASGVWTFLGRWFAKTKLSFNPKPSRATLRSHVWLGMLLIFGATLFSGCAQLTERAQSNDAATRLVVTYATLKYVEQEKTVEEKTARAGRVDEVVGKIRTYVSADKMVTVTALKAYVVDQIDWTKLDAADQVAAHGLIDLIGQELESRIQDKSLNSDAVVVVSWVLDVVDEAVKPYLK